MTEFREELKELITTSFELFKASHERLRVCEWITLSLFANITGMFELNNFEVKIPTVVHTQFTELVRELPENERSKLLEDIRVFLIEMRTRQEEDEEEDAEYSRSITISNKYSYILSRNHSPTHTHTHHHGQSHTTAHSVDGKRDESDDGSDDVDLSTDQGVLKEFLQYFPHVEGSGAFRFQTHTLHKFHS